MTAPIDLVQYFYAWSMLFATLGALLFWPVLHRRLVDWRHVSITVHGHRAPPWIYVVMALGTAAILSVMAANDWWFFFAREEVIERTGRLSWRSSHWFVVGLRAGAIVGAWCHCFVALWRVNLLFAALVPAGLSAAGAFLITGDY